MIGKSRLNRQSHDSLSNLRPGLWVIMQTVLGQVPKHLARVRNAERIANLENASVSSDCSFGITPTSWNEEDVPKIEPLVGELGKEKDALGRDKEKLVRVEPGGDVANDLVDDTGKEAKGGRGTACRGR